jgi:hypothetical protein
MKKKNPKLLVMPILRASLQRVVTTTETIQIKYLDRHHTSAVFPVDIFWSAVGDATGIQGNVFALSMVP